MDIYSREQMATIATVLKQDERAVVDELIKEAALRLIDPDAEYDAEEDPAYLIGNDELLKFKKRYYREMGKRRIKELPYIHFEDLHIKVLKELSFRNRPYYKISREV